jgi:Uma2 family endonuclease
MTLMEPQTRRWTLDEYYRLSEQGWFQGQRVLLLDGEIIQMPAQHHPHSIGILRLERALRPLFEPRAFLRTQMPFNVGLDSDPEPDLAVIQGKLEDLTDHPTTALLIVEVSDSTLRLDRRKANTYASALIPEYWILNVTDLELEIFRNPRAGQYLNHQIARPGDIVSPLSAPQSSIPVKELFD